MWPGTKFMHPFISNFVYVIGYSGNKSKDCNETKHSNTDPTNWPNVVFHVRSGIHFSPTYNWYDKATMF